MMASRLGLRATRTLRFRHATPVRPQQPSLRRGYADTVAGSDKEASKAALKSGAKQDPELYVLGAIMAGVFALAGWHFSRSPTSTTSESSVSKVPGSEPWNTGSHAKYQYHPEGDTSQEPRDAPSALNVVVIPNVNLPKELHEAYNRWGKDGYP